MVLSWLGGRNANQLGVMGIKRVIEVIGGRNMSESITIVDIKYVCPHDAPSLLQSTVQFQANYEFFYWLLSYRFKV